MFRAKDTFWAPGNRRIVKGDLVSPHDPVVEGREELFEAVVIPQAVQPTKSVGERGPEFPPPAEPTNPDKPEDPGGDGDEDGQAEPEPTPAPAAKKTTARKTTTAARRGTGGDAK